LHSPEAYGRFAAPLRPLLAKELREISSGRALWTMLLLLCPLVGYSFFQAVSLYGEASTAALQSPVLASSLSPLDGILVPTLGSFYVAVTLLFPFVSIRALGQEKETGALRLLVQLPYRPSTLVSAKLIAVLAAWCLAFIPALSALVIWRILGGRLALLETANLLFGHLVYGLLIGALALFSASIAESAATAAIVALAVTIGSWVLDFTVAGNPGLLSWLAQLSLTQTLRPFEQGLLSGGLVLGVVCAILGLVALATVWLPPGVPLLGKLRRSLACAVIVALMLGIAAQVRATIDVSEDRRNSFPSADQRLLATLRLPLHVTVHLASEDPRYADLQRNVLATRVRNAERVGQSRNASAGFRRREQRRVLWRGRIRLWQSIRRQPVNQPPGDFAAALRTCRRFASRSNARRRISRLSAGRRRLCRAVLVFRRVAASDCPLLVVDAPPTFQLARA
jgi:ABC-2 type transport system permease protein